MTIILLALPLAPVSAAAWDPVSSAKAEESLVAQLWQWLTSLFSTETSSGEISTSGTCLSSTTGRGCAIDPNGGY